MKKGRYDKSRNLGGFYPYYQKSENRVEFANTIGELMGDAYKEHRIDELSVLQVLNRYFIFGDRTIIQGVKRAPWMGKYDSEKKSWSFHSVPEHGFQTNRSESEIADELFSLIRDEVKLYIGSQRKVGILLSGGMDSRIVAGVLKSLINEEEIEVDSVTAYTWGEGDSRDVVYSKRIAELFGWKWKHFYVTADDLWENFKIAGERGCEYTGLHLHAIPQISRNIKSEVDVMLAGSYGDSVGRAEYSGKHVTELLPVHRKVRNPAHLLKSTVYQQIKDKWNEDIEKYHKLFPRNKTFQQRELDYQIHYMRRMLNPCMELINEEVDMHQVFTHPKVFGFMWSLDPQLRNDKVYQLLLKKFFPDLLSIPWARTGLQYPLKEGEPDQFKKKHHLYSGYIQKDLMDRIESRLLGHSAIQNGIFNTQSVREILKLIKKRNNYNFDYLEKISWLISYTYLFDKFDNVHQSGSPNSLSDTINAKIKAPLEYNLRHGYRKIRK